MEKQEEQKWELQEEDDDYEASSLLQRTKSKLGKVVDQEIMETYVVDNLEANDEVSENGSQEKESTLGNEEKMAEIEEILENEASSENGHHHKEENPVQFDIFEGIDLTSTSSGDETADENPEYGKLEILTQKFEARKESLSNLNIQPSNISNEGKGETYLSSKDKGVETDQIHVEEPEETDLDVEGVLQTQTTHDLYCPNCNSCITRRVILRKRKRRVQISEGDIERKLRNKTEITLVSDQGSISSVQVPRGFPEVGVEDDDDRDTGPDLFRCLSCFSFFIQCGSSFRLFKTPGDRSKNENVGNEQISSRKKNWFSSIFAPKKLEIPVERGKPHASEIGKSAEEIDNLGLGVLSPRQQFPLHASEPRPDNIQTEKIDEEITQLLPNKAQAFITSELDKTLHVFEATPHEELHTEAKTKQFEGYTSYHLKEPQITKDDKISSQGHLFVTTVVNTTKIISEESRVDTVFLTQRKGGSNFTITSDDGQPAFEESEENKIIHQIAQKGGSDQEITQLSPTNALVFTTSVMDKTLILPKVVPHEKQRTETITESTYEDFTSSGDGTETTITIVASPVSAVDQVILVPEDTECSIHDTAQVGAPVQELTTRREDTKIEVIKSIVYGGLAETITSLSVVSSASGGSAATINIVALGMANLIGGFFVICHNLWDLKCDRIVQASGQVTEQKDRYKELLGRRENFTLHAIVSILSYILFGLMPIALYGFSFQKSDDKELKLLVVGAASLVCIVVLSIGKAYVCRPPKDYLKTVGNFLVLGFMASGISYAAGVLIKRLLDKLGLFQPTGVDNLLLSGMLSKDSAWASY